MLFAGEKKKERGKKLAAMEDGSSWCFAAIQRQSGFSLLNKSNTHKCEHMEPLSCV